MPELLLVPDILSPIGVMHFHGVVDSSSCQRRKLYVPVHMHECRGLGFCQCVGFSPLTHTIEVSEYNSRPSSKHTLREVSKDTVIMWRKFLLLQRALYCTCSTDLGLRIPK